MGNSHFSFKQFTIHQDHCAMKVTTDACLFGAWVNSKVRSAEKMLDIGAGTGLLSLMMAQGRSIEIDAVEIEETCFEQLCSNIKNNPIGKRINPIRNDIRLLNTDKKYDLIVSNPPFYEKQLKSDMTDINLARHSDQLSLRDLFLQVKKMIKNNGHFFLLMPYYRKSECMEMAASHGLFPQTIALAKQSIVHEPFRAMFCFTTSPGETTTEEIAIKKNAPVYTDAFYLLMKDYYLYL